MVPGTHLLIARIVYGYMLKKTDFKLDYQAFAYGNIKPDLDKSCINYWHTFEDSVDIINAYAEELIESKISVKEFSEALGMICHFVCDYFCLHHGRQYWKKDPVAHGVYEVKLHLSFVNLCRNENIKISYKCKSEKNLKDIVSKLRRKYNLEPDGMAKDISYAIIAAAVVSEFIIRSVKRNIIAAYHKNYIPGI
jgi:hypothetical protein